MLNNVASMLVVAAIAFATTWFLVPFAQRVAHRYGAIDMPSERRVHKVPMTRMGGIAIFSGMLLAFLLIPLLVGQGVFAPSLLLPSNINSAVFLLSFVIMFLVGAIDDVVQLDAKVKFAGQVVAASVAVGSGVLLNDIFSGVYAVYVSFGIWAYPITVFYLVAFANIINLIDGLDGLAAGVAGISGLAFIVISCQLGLWSVAALSCGLVASCLAFLRFNFHPARLFMGDCGSLTIGFALGVISLLGTMRVSSVTSLAVPVVVAAIPVIDTLAAIIRRKRTHVSISAPDKGHIHHSLLRLGMSQRRAVLTIYAVCAVFAASGVIIAGSRLAIRFAVVFADLIVAALLVWKLRLFGQILGRYYPEGKPKNFSFPWTRSKASALSTSRSSHDSGKLKILMVCQHYWPETFQVTEICEELAARGHDVTALVGTPNYPSGIIPPEYRHGANRLQERGGVHIVRAKEVPRGKNPLRLALNYYSFSISACGIIRELPDDFDVVFAYQLSPIMMAEPAVRYAKAHRVPMLLYCCDLWPESMKVILGNKFSWLLEYYRKVSRRIYAAADKIAVQSPSFMDYFEQILEMERETCVYVPQHATGEFVDMDFDEPHGGVNISVLGNVGRAQDVDVILRAVAKMETKKGFQIHIVGDGPLLEQMIVFARDLGIDEHVTFHGRRPLEEMPDYYRMSDACLLALNGDSWIGTTIPSRLQGYMAAGKPVLAAVSGGAATVIEESGCGEAVAAGDFNALAGLLDRFVSDPQAFRTCGERGRAYFKRHFTKDKHIDTLEKLLMDLAKGKQA